MEHGCLKEHMPEETSQWIREHFQYWAMEMQITTHLHSRERGFKDGVHRMPIGSTLRSGHILFCLLPLYRYTFIPPHPTQHTNCYARWLVVVRRKVSFQICSQGTFKAGILGGSEARDQNDPYCSPHIHTQLPNTFSHCTHRSQTEEKQVFADGNNKQPHHSKGRLPWFMFSVILISSRSSGEPGLLAAMYQSASHPSERENKANI